MFSRAEISPEFFPEYGSISFPAGSKHKPVRSVHWHLPSRNSLRDCSCMKLNNLVLQSHQSQELVGNLPAKKNSDRMQPQTMQILRGSL